MKAIACAFDLQLKDVRHAFEKGDTIPRGRGEHLALEEDIEQQLTDWIAKNSQNHTAINQTELPHYCRGTFRAVVTAGWVDSFFLRHKLELSEMISRPQENPRLEILPSFLNPTIECLNEHLRVSCP
jgi:hypothetical protein